MSLHVIKKQVASEKTRGIEEETVDNRNRRLPNNGVIKHVFQVNLINTFKKLKGKLGESQLRSRSHQREPNGNSRTEKH